MLHSNHAPTRRVAARVGNQVLGSLFQGKIVVGNIDRLDLGLTSHLHVTQAEILDPQGQRVLVANGIDAGIDLARLVRSVLAGRTPEVAIDDATIDSADLLLDLDAAGSVAIARAFDSLPSTKPPRPLVPGAPLACIMHGFTATWCRPRSMPAWRTSRRRSRSSTTSSW